jgi:hypothetical protein
MTHADHQPTRIATPLPPMWAEAGVAVALANGDYLLDDGRIACQAASCLVLPQQGDRVLVASCRNNDHYIVHLLSRPAGDNAVLAVPGAAQLTLRQPKIALTASDRITVQALNDVELTAATGVMTLCAHNLFATVAGTFVQNVREYVANAEHYLLNAKQLLRMHGKQASITAEHDVKVDAERISLG